MLSRDELYAYQRRAVSFIKARPRCALWVDVGLGKTVSVLTAFADLYESLDARRMLVVAPLRVARDVWDEEVAGWAHLQGLTVSKIVGSKQERIDALRVPADIHTINREQLGWLFSGYVEEVARNRFKQVRKWPWDFLALDEAQSFKNQEAARTKAAHRVSTFNLATRIVEMTGSPSPNGYQDIWSQLYVLDHGQRLGRTEDAFLQRWFEPPNEWEFKPRLKEHAAAEIQKAVADLVLSMQAEDYLDLPPVVYNEIKVTLPPGALKQYRQLERTAVLELAERTITAANAGVLGSKLLQLASGAVYVDRHGTFEELHTAKLDALCEALDELAFSGPVLIGYGFKSDVARIAERLTRYCGKSRKWSVLKTAAEMKAFGRGEIDFGVGHPASMGEGLNDLYLSGAENIIWFGPTNNLLWWDQFNGRLAGGRRRIGKNIVIQTITARGTVDEDYIQMTRAKSIDQVGLVKALRARN